MEKDAFYIKVTHNLEKSVCTKYNNNIEYNVKPVNTSQQSGEKKQDKVLYINSGYTPDSVTSHIFHFSKSIIY